MLLVVVVVVVMVVAVLLLLVVVAAVMLDALLHAACPPGPWPARRTKDRATAGEGTL